MCQVQLSSQSHINMTFPRWTALLIIILMNMPTKVIQALCSSEAFTLMDQLLHNPHQPRDGDES